MTYHAYELTWEELLEAAGRQDAVTSFEGYLICSRDRKLDAHQAKFMHKRSVALAISRGKEVPSHVRDWYEQEILQAGIEPDHARRAAFDPPPPKEGSSPLVNAKGKPFSWSPSALNDFLTCPKQYAARRFYVTLPYVETEAMRQGTIEHKHLELRLKDKTPLPVGYTRGEKYVRAVEKWSEGGEVFAERQIAISENLDFVSWFDKSAWGRCVVDVTAVKDDAIAIFDWKTGKPKSDTLQLKINTCFLSLEFPEAEKFINKFIWLKHDQTSGEVFTKDQIPALWEEVLGLVERVKKAWQTENWPCRPSGLCRGWCDVKDCVHWAGAR